MSQKTWRLVVTELGGSSALHEVTVEAANWMSALKTGRAELGEAGGVPTGASCAVAPDGKVTIHDPMARRTYVLTPDVAKSFTRNKPSGPRIPADGAAEEESAPAQKVSKKTIAYAAPPLGGGGQVPASPQATPAPEPAQAPAAAAAPPPAQAAAAPEPAQVAPAPQPAPAQPAPAPAPAQPAPAQPAPAQPAPVPAPSCELLSGRDEDPSEQSPLHYRERTFVVPEGTPKEAAEAALRERFEALRQQLAGEPPGKFFNLAVFDHRWEGRPKRPPVVTLQWKDWRGDPETSYPLEAKLAAKAARAREAAPSPAPAAQPKTAPPSAGPPARRRTRTDEQDARLAHAFEAAQDLFFLSTPAEGLDFAIRLLDELIPSEAASACLYDINTDEFRFVALSGPGADERKGEAVPSRTGLLGAAAERVGAAFIAADVTNDPRFDPGIDGRVGLEPRNALYMSLHHQGRLFGVLQLINRRDRDAFGQADAEVVGYVGKQLSEFLYQARIAPDRGARI